MLRDFRNEKIHSILSANQFGFFLNSDLSFHADGVEKCPKNVHILYKSLKHVHMYLSCILKIFFFFHFS